MGLQHSLLPLAILAVGAGTGSAPAQLLGPEFQVNSYTTGSQASGKVAADRTGKFVVVWQSVGQDGDGSGVFGQRFAADDLPLGEEFQVNQYTTEQEHGPVVATDGGGSFVVTWSNYPSRQKIVSARRYDAAGLPLGDEFQVNSYTTLRTSRAVDVAADEAGNFVVIWYYEADFGGVGLIVNGGYGQRFDAAGQSVGDVFGVGDGSINLFGGLSSNVGGDSVAATGPGEFVVGQKNCTGYPQPEICGPTAQRYDGAGPVGSEIYLEDAANMAVNGTPVGVASAGAGEFVVAWSAYPYYGVHSRTLFARRIDASGVPLGEKFAVSNYTTSQAQNAVVAADRKGNFVVVWYSGGIFGQRFAADGSRIGSEFQVDSASSAGSSPSVAAGNVGDFIVVWQSGDGSGSGLTGRRIRSSIFWGGFELGNPCGWSTVVGGGCP